MVSGTLSFSTSKIDQLPCGVRVSVFHENVIPVLDCVLDSNVLIRSRTADQVDVVCLIVCIDIGNVVRDILRDLGYDQRSIVWLIYQDAVISMLSPDF